MKLENEKIYLEVSNQAAEIHHLINKENHYEYMWQGLEKYWTGRNPILFPIVGSVFKKEYTIDGKNYKMGNHGLARHAYFQTVEESEDKIVLLFSSDQETKKQYPFDFDFFVTYSLDDDKVKIDFKVVNKSDGEMPFTFGLHPAFNLPIDPSEKQEDYWLQLDAPEVMDLYQGNGEFLKEDKATDRIELDRVLGKMFLIRNPKTKEVSLTNGKHSVTIQVEDYRYLAFWNKPESPFLCLEPWYSTTDFVDNDTPFAQRDGMFILKKGEEKEFHHYIKIK